MENFKIETEGTPVDEGFFIEADYPFKISPTFSTMGSNIEIKPGRGWQSSFVRADTLIELFGFKPTATLDEHNLSDFPVDIF